MPNKTFQAFFVMISLLCFPKLTLGQTESCPPAKVYAEAKDLIALEALSHPFCLKAFVQETINKKYLNLKQWRQAFQTLQVAQRLPISWKNLHQLLPLLLDQNNNSQAFRQAWALMEERAHQQSLSQFAKEQPAVWREIQKTPQSPETRRRILAINPFFYNLNPNDTPSSMAL